MFFRTRAEAARKPEWAAWAARRVRPRPMLLQRRCWVCDASAADYEIVRGKFPAVSEACTACHRAFAREAPTITP